NTSAWAASTADETAPGASIGPIERPSLSGTMPLMRILFAIPHYYTVQGSGRHGSEGGDAERRARATRLCLAALQQTFSESQGLSDGRGGVRIHTANPDLRATITIALCTTSGSHLVPDL